MPTLSLREFFYEVPIGVGFLTYVARQSYLARAKNTEEVWFMPLNLIPQIPPLPDTPLMQNSDFQWKPE